MDFNIGQSFEGKYPPEEEWKDTPGFDGHYKISSFGRIISEYKGWKEKRPSLQKSGYLYVDLYINHEKRRSSIHRLVAEVFIPNLENKPQVNHKDGNKLNNSVSNLEWVTASENMIHATHIIKTNVPQKIRDVSYPRKLSQSGKSFIRPILQIALRRCDVFKSEKFFQVYERQRNTLTSANVGCIW